MNTQEFIPGAENSQPMKSNKINRGETAIHKYISRLTEQELEPLLKKLAAHINLYAELLHIADEDVEYLKKQQAAFSWMVSTSGMLKQYASDIRFLTMLMRNNGNNAVRPSCMFLDLPRPPVLYPDMDLNRRLGALILKIKASTHYREDIGIHLGIHDIE